ncbi:putative nuclease HARBI1 [Nylanderia fulva]|uniref:putative nuclease HARBI1 n=1 Tax=Nylanderia fulva TaxID=613905 RepID=UPI0010FB4DCE|nr:putative nuclease HARBI1 [Nylanderia fulva]
MEFNILGQFDINLFESSDSSSDEENDENEEIGIIREKRYVRDAINPFTAYREHEFHIRYRFSKNSVMHGLLPLVINGLTKPDNRGLPIEPVIQLLICLRYYATSSFQKVNGDLMKLPQPTISRIIFRVTMILASYLNSHVKFVTHEGAIQENRRLFKELGYGRFGAIGLPYIDGAIDCTHIRLLSNNFGGLAEMYRNRKGYFSLNVQAIVGPRMEFLDLVPEWPGREHDSRIFQNSRIFMRYQQRELTGMIVGDSGYPALTFLLTPFRNPQNEEEQKYNEIQSRTRMVVERTFGVWKRRFPCLSRGLSLKLVTCTGVVSAYAVLHNLALYFKDVLPEEPEVDVIIEDNEELYYNELQQPGDGFIVRQNIVRDLFR